MAYAPFRQALAQHFEVNLLAPPGPKIQQISQALGGIFGSVIPFARHSLSPFGGRRRLRRPGRSEIHASIAWMLRRLAKTGPVLLFLDDVQWLDEASRGAGRASARGVSRRQRDSAGHPSGGQRQGVFRRAGPGRRPRRHRGRLSHRCRSRRRFSPAASASSRPSPKRFSRASARPGKRRRTALAAPGGGEPGPLGRLGAHGGRIRLGQRRVAGGFHDSESHPGGDPGAVGTRRRTSHGPGMCGVRLQRPRVSRQRAGRRPGHARASTCWRSSTRSNARRA